MNERQQKEVAQAPVSCRGTLVRAYEGSAPPRGAIRAFCLYCTGYTRADISDCTALACPLWNYRPYQAGADDDAAPDQDELVSQDASGEEH